MSGNDSGPEKTEAPTPKKLKDSRKEGTVARTADFGAWAGILSASLLVPGIAQGMVERGAELVSVLVEVIETPEPALAFRALRTGALDIVVLAGPLSLMLLLICLGLGASQGGVHLASKRLKPDPKHWNPVKGIKRMFGPQGLWELVKALFKTIVLGLVLWYVVGATVPDLIGSGTLSLGTTVASVSESALRLMQVAGATGVGVAVLDYVVIRRRTNKQLRMTHEEVKKENKQTEGDPLLKQAIRSRQFAMSRNRMMSDVGTADAVLVNPTHIAIAVRYDPAKGAPRVVAKGSGAIALRIKELAREHGVPIVVDVPLARALHAGCEVGSEVPVELYTAVARVLAFVMRLRRTGRRVDPATEHRLPTAV